MIKGKGREEGKEEREQMVMEGKKVQWGVKGRRRMKEKGSRQGRKRGNGGVKKKGDDGCKGKECKGKNKLMSVLEGKGEMQIK